MHMMYESSAIINAARQRHQTYLTSNAFNPDGSGATERRVRIRVCLQACHTVAQRTAGFIAAAALAGITQRQKETTSADYLAASQTRCSDPSPFFPNCTIANPNHDDPGHCAFGLF